MATFLMLGKYTGEGVKGATAARTKKITDLIGKSGAKVDAMYALLGKYDLAFIVTAPSNDEAMKASFAVSKSAGIAFSTFPAVPVAEFDRMIGD
jgi:uncharacterized protein with GYD domain